MEPGADQATLPPPTRFNRRTEHERRTRDGNLGHIGEKLRRRGVEWHRRASKTLRNVKGAWVKESHVAVEGGSIKHYRVNMMVTSLLED